MPRNVHKQLVHAYWINIFIESSRDRIRYQGLSSSMLRDTGPTKSITVLNLLILVRLLVSDTPFGLRLFTFLSFLTVSLPL